MSWDSILLMPSIPAEPVVGLTATSVHNENILPPVEPNGGVFFVEGHALIKRDAWDDFASLSAGPANRPSHAFNDFVLALLVTPTAVNKTKINRIRFIALRGVVLIKTNSPWDFGPPRTGNSRRGRHFGFPRNGETIPPSSE